MSKVAPHVLARPGLHWITESVSGATGYSTTAASSLHEASQPPPAKSGNDAALEQPSERSSCMGCFRPGKPKQQLVSATTSLSEADSKDSCFTSAVVGEVAPAERYQFVSSHLAPRTTLPACSCLVYTAAAGWLSNARCDEELNLHM